MFIRDINDYKVMTELTPPDESVLGTLMSSLQISYVSQEIKKPEILLRQHLEDVISSQIFNDAEKYFNDGFNVSLLKTQLSTLVQYYDKMYSLLTGNDHANEIKRKCQFFYDHYISCLSIYIDKIIKPILDKDITKLDQAVRSYSFVTNKIKVMYLYLDRHYTCENNLFNLQCVASELWELKIGSKYVFSVSKDMSS
jgi:hypothetical protein